IQPLIGYNYGARQISRVKKTLWYGVCGAVALGTVMWVIVHVFPTQIIGAFGIKDAGVVEFSTFALQVQLMMMPLVGFQIVGSNYFQATGQPLKSVILTLTRQIIFLIPLLLILPLLIPYLFPQFNNLQGLCFGYPSADFLSIFTTGVFVLFEMRRLKKLERGGGKATHSSNREMATEEAEGTLEALPTAAK
ncbi:MAG: MATE family efflux transporter, partial [Eggerthellaceae bacterium]|nr:MATE family efflux transporter [Eggerthellaceae bacterium]